MALKATIYKATLDISDLRRQYYDRHSLTVALHPSETEARMLVRLLAFGLYADPELKFTRGLSTVEEPDLWRKNLREEVELWIEVGQPEVRRLRQACGKAQQVAVIASGGRSAAVWWQKNARELAGLHNLSVTNLALPDRFGLATPAGRNLSLQLTIDADRLWLTAGDRTLEIGLESWQV